MFYKRSDLCYPTFLLKYEWKTWNNLSFDHHKIFIMTLSSNEERQIVYFKIKTKNRYICP